MNSLKAQATPPPALDASEAAREHHYHFAHRVLPHLFLEDPQRFIAHLEEDAERVIGAWRFAHDTLRRGGARSQALPSEGLRVERGVEVAGWRGVLIHLPEPRRPTEAYALLLLAQGARGAYFTLELGVDVIEETHCTFLCEWKRVDGNMRHGNFGRGPDDVRGFTRAVEQTLQDDRT